MLFKHYFYYGVDTFVFTGLYLWTKLVLIQLKFSSSYRESHYLRSHMIKLKPRPISLKQKLQLYTTYLFYFIQFTGIF